MANLNGFVKLHRKMIEWGWYSDCVVKDVFLHILMVAAFKPGQYLGYDLVPGQAIIGRQKMAKELGFSEQQIRTALKKLESTGEITLLTTNRFTIATVENWDFYQCEDYVNISDDYVNEAKSRTKKAKKSTSKSTSSNDLNINTCEQTATSTLTNKQPTDNQQITNKQTTDNHILRNKESKECKEGKKVKNIYNDLPQELHEPLDAFIEMRKTIKSPLTDRALGMMLKKLNDLSGGDMQKAAKILNQSTINCWKGIYELKENKRVVAKSDNPFLEELRRMENEQS